MNGSIAALNAVQRVVGSANFREWQVVREQKYDFVRLPVAGTNQLNFFANGTGQTDPTSGLQKTLEQTNVQQAGTLGQIFYVIQEIRTFIHVLPLARQAEAISTDADVLFTTWRAVAPVIKQLCQNGVFNLIIGQKQYSQIVLPFVDAPPGFGVEVTAWGNLGTDSGMIAQQSNHGGDVWSCTPPQMIEPSQTFSANIQFPQNNSPSLASLVNSADLAINVGVIFDGFTFRPNQ